MSDERASPNTQTERVALDGPTYDMLVAKVVLATKDHIEADASRARAKFATALTVGGALSIAAVTGVATFALATLKQTLLDTATRAVELRVPVEVDNAIDSAIKALTPDLQQSLQRTAQEFTKQTIDEQLKMANVAMDSMLLQAKLRAQIEEFDRSGGFTETEMASVISMIRSSASDPEVRGSDDFSTLLERVIDHQFGASRLDLFRELEAEFKPEILKSIMMTSTVTTWLGRQISYFPVRPDELSGGRLEEEWKKLVEDYNSYAAASIENKYPEIPLVYDIILACMESQSAAVMAALISRVDDIREEEFNYALGVAAELSGESWRTSEDEDTQLARERTENCARANSEAPGLSPRAREMLAAMMPGGEEVPLDSESTPGTKL